MKGVLLKILKKYAKAVAVFLVMSSVVSAATCIAMINNRSMAIGVAASGNYYAQDTVVLDCAKFGSGNRDVPYCVFRHKIEVYGYSAFNPGVWSLYSTITHYHQPVCGGANNLNPEKINLGQLCGNNQNFIRFKVIDTISTTYTTNPANNVQQKTINCYATTSPTSPVSAVSSAVVRQSPAAKKAAPKKK